MRVAIVQTQSTDDLEANLAFAERGIREAAGLGARFVALPENFAYMRREGSPFPCVQRPGGEIYKRLSEWARGNQIWLLGGTVPEAIEGDTDRVHNTSVVYSPAGEEVARYRKMHLFDVDLSPDGADSYRESKHFKAGDEVVLAETDFGDIGLSVCYDLRFPELYREMVRRGARWLTVPSAFTPENGTRSLGSAAPSPRDRKSGLRCGPRAVRSPHRGPGKLWTLSHHLTLGVVLAQGTDRPGVLVADCPTDEIDRVRSAIPALKNRRL